MSAINTCRHFKYGYCRFTNRCRLQHSSKICEKEDCNVNLCQDRHPRTCKFFAEYGRCKFGEFCLYSHNVKNLTVHEKEINALRVKVKDLEEEIGIMKVERDVVSNRLLEVETCCRTMESRHSVSSENSILQLSNDVTSLDSILHTVVTDVAELKEISDLLKLRSGVTYDEFSAHSKMVNKLEERVRRIEDFIRRYLSKSAVCASPAPTPPTPPVSLVKKSRQ